MRTSTPTPVERVGGTAREQVIVRGVYFPAGNGTNELEFSLIHDSGDRTLSGFVHIAFLETPRIVGKQIRTGHCAIDASDFVDDDLMSHNTFITVLAKQWGEVDPLFMDGRPVLVLREIDGIFRSAPEIHPYVTDLYEIALSEILKLLAQANSTAQETFYDTLLKRLSGLVAGCKSRYARELGNGTPLVPSAGNGIEGKSQPTAVSQESQG